jgi:hypothetical protein
LSSGAAATDAGSSGLRFGSVGEGLLAVGFGGSLNDDGAVNCVEGGPDRGAGAALRFVWELRASWSFLKASCSAACFCHLVDAARCDTPSGFVVDDPKDCRVRDGVRRPTGASPCSNGFISTPRTGEVLAVPSGRSQKLAEERP